MTTTRRKRTAAGASKTTAPAARGLTARDIADFMALEEPDLGVFDQALDAAKEAAADFLGHPLPEELPHEIAHGIRLLTSKLLLENRTEKPAPEDIPLTVRYFWTLADGNRAQA
jgi:hypothetical protein